MVMDKRIGAQYFTIREFCQNIEDFDKACKKVKEIGYKTVQLSGIGNFSADEIKPILEKYGLQAVCTHRPPDSYLNNIEGEIEFHKKIGCKICGIGCMPGFNVEKENIEKFIKDFSSVTKKLDESGLIFAYHNHAIEFEKVKGKYVFDIITDSMAADNFKYILDVYWLSYAGINPAKFIRERKGKIACVHFKDLKVVSGQPQFAEIGQGNIDWDDVISACEEAEVKYALVEKDRCDGNPFDSLKISYDFLKNKGFC